MAELKAGENGDGVQEDLAAGGSRRIFLLKPSIVPGLISGIAVAFALTLTNFLLNLSDNITVASAFCSCMYTPMLVGLVLVFGWGLLNRLNAQYELTTEQLKVKASFLGTSRQSTALSEIQQVESRQSVVQRLLGFGDVIVETNTRKGIIKLRDLKEGSLRSEQILEAIRRVNDLEVE